MHALIHAEAHAAISRIAAAHEYDRDELAPEVITECERYGVELHTYCQQCHGEDAHESWCTEGICDICNKPGCPGDCADRAWDAWREERLADDGKLWEGE